MSFVIGIAGGSGSGKTTIANAIMDSVSPGQAVMLAHDNYYRDLSDISIADRAVVNFDHPDSLESSLLAQHLEQLKQNLPINMPTYDFTHHTRAPKTITIHPAEVILVEGILTLASPELVPLFDLKIFVDTDSDIRFIRRLTRDIKDRGRSLEAVIAQYQQTVRPMYLEFVEPSKRYADIIIPEGGHNTAALDLVLGKIQSLYFTKNGGDARQ